MRFADKKVLVSSLLLIWIFLTDASLAAGPIVDCNDIKTKAAEINPDPDVQIAPANSGFWVPRAYIRSFRRLAAQPSLISSAQLTVLLPAFLPVRTENDPGILGKGWGDTATISISQIGAGKTASEFLSYFLGESLNQKEPTDALGFDVFLLQNGLDTANELHVSPDRSKFLLCSDTPGATYNYCETVVNMVSEVNIKMTFSVNYLADFSVLLDGLAHFLSCLTRR